MNAFLARLKQPSPASLMPLLAVAVIVSLLLVALTSFNTSKISHSFQSGITTDFELQQLSGEVIHLDEVLTMSSRMAAATGDLSWEKRYKAYEPILIDTINQAIESAPEAYEIHARQIDSANAELIKLEKEAFSLVRQKKTKEALEVLFSDRYNTEKELYANGIQLWTQFLDQKIADDLKRYNRGLFWSNVFSLTSFWLLMLAWVVLLKRIHQFIRRRTITEQSLCEAQQQLQVTQQDLQSSREALQQTTQTLATAHQELQQTHVQMVQSEKLSSVGRLAAGIAQGVAVPLNAVYASLHKLKSSTDPQRVDTDMPQNLEKDQDVIQPDAAQLLDAMENNVQYISQTMCALSNFSQRSYSQSSESSQIVDIHGGIESILLLLQYRIRGTVESPESESSGKSSESGPSSERPPVEIVRKYGSLPKVECYPGLINQVFMHLFSNAIDALDEAYDRLNALDEQARDELKGRLKCQIRVHTATVTDIFNVQWVHITIADTGLGIPEDVQDRIFDQFFTTKPMGQGTGVGLSLSYDIITQQHDGRLTFSSDSEAGTEFVIQLPLTLSTQSSPTQSSSTAQSTDSSDSTDSTHESHNVLENSQNRSQQKSVVANH
ncbi:MAG: sensor histidine kinase [Cyanobacteria bacterium P01_F01_bin.53]